MIQPKEKPCKGTGQAKGYGCKEKQLYRTYGLGHACGCYNAWLLETPEGQDKMKRSIISAKKKIVKQKRSEEFRRKKEWKQKHKSIAKLIQEARVPFQKYIRTRDKDRPCISCGNYHAEIYDGGHYYKAELYSGMVFDEDNVHKQCRKCNSYIDGNESGYRLGLIRRYGQDFVNQLDQRAKINRSKKYERQEVIDLKALYSKKLKNILKNN